MVYEYKRFLKGEDSRDYYSLLRIDDTQACVLKNGTERQIYSKDEFLEAFYELIIEEDDDGDKTQKNKVLDFLVQSGCWHI